MGDAEVKHETPAPGLEIVTTSTNIFFSIIFSASTDPVFITAVPITKLFAWGETMEDWYKRNCEGPKS
jgi:hypothetical protein